MRLFLLLSLLLPATMLQAQPLRFESGIRQTQMIELFTSEGCSSCPPAERFLNEYREDEQLWRHYIPLAFHVDYWDYLGWKDRYALPGNSRRQYRYARHKRLSQVYTPGLVVNGREWRGWRYGGRSPRPGAEVGNLAVQVEGERMEVRFTPRQARQESLVLNYALLGMGMKTHIRAGENRGRHASHDFVVLAHERILGSTGAWHAPLPEAGHQAQRRALVVWLERPGDPAPLQAAGAYLPAR